MTATRTILLALICSAASVTLAAQEAESDASKKDAAQPGNSPTNTVPHFQQLQFQPFNLWSQNETSDLVFYFFLF